MVDIPTPLKGARISYLEAWAHQLEGQSAIMTLTGNHAKAADAREKAQALRDTASTLRELLGITYTPINTKPTMEIRDELDRQRVG